MTAGLLSWVVASVDGLEVRASRTVDVDPYLRDRFTAAGTSAFNLAESLRRMFEDRADPGAVMEVDLDGRRVIVFGINDLEIAIVVADQDADTKALQAAFRDGAAPETDQPAGPAPGDRRGVIPQP
ncbi:hypothetical protein [Dactylosporangium sp. CA-233914]|uniref:hypothetical protein n=1 Tax=Dactylosporangium sp. CA-233914 TaxID=3239934 RepID=UPI003D8F1760